MKQYIAIAALIAAGAAFANADEYTINPLSNESAYNYYIVGQDGQKEQVSYTEYLNANEQDIDTTEECNWASVSVAYPGYTANPTTLGNDKYAWKENNIKGISSYTDFNKIVLDSADDYLKFSYRFIPGKSKNATTMLTLALVGEEGAIVTGFTGTKPVSYAVTDKIADSYSFGATWTEANLTGTQLNNSLTAISSVNSGYYTVEGSIAWDEAVSEFVLNLILSQSTQDYAKDENGEYTGEKIIVTTMLKDTTVALGEGFDINELIISVDCASRVYPELYDLALTWGSASFSVPEPSAFGLLAGLGALALAGTRRRRR